MHALFFEVRPHPGHLEHYFAHVDRLRPVLARHTGLTFLDRYTARDDAAVLLSHQLWESEDAIIRWRQDATHRRSQEAGRRVHFEDYRIRVGARVLHHTPEAGLRAPDAGAAAMPHVVAVYATAVVAHPGLSWFDSVNHPGRHVALAGVADRSAARALLETTTAAPALSGAITEAAAYAIRRDYTLHDRAQAPR